MNTLKISATFTGKDALKQAVEASKMDLSYNQKLAGERIIRIAHDGNVSTAYLMEDGSVWYVYHADIKLLNKFDPFISCLTNEGFQLVSVHDGRVYQMPVNWDYEARINREGVKHIQTNRDDVLATKGA